MHRPLFFLLILLLVGCGAKDPIESEVRSYIMPLAVGNSWTYELNTFLARVDTFGEAIDTMYIEHIDGQETREITAKVVIDGEEWYRIVRHWVDTITVIDYIDSVLRDTLHFYDSANWSDYYTNRATGLWWREDANDTPSLDTKFPVRVGELYSPNEWIQFEVVSVNEPVDVPAGVFTCYHYVRTPTDQFEPPDTSHGYFAPDVGFIKYSGRIYSADDSGSVVLKGYELR